jgi:hypothetical protein
LKGTLAVLEARLGGHDIRRAAAAQKADWKSHPTGTITLHYRIDQVKFQIKWAENTVKLIRELSEQ